MKSIIVRFIREEEAQDLVEYTLLLAFVCFASAALFIGAGATLQSIWNTANLILSNANTQATNGS